MIDGDFSVGSFCSATGEAGVELSGFCVCVVVVEAEAKTAVLSVLGFLFEGSSRDGSDRSVTHVKTRGRKTRLTSTINSTYHSVSSALNLFRTSKSPATQKNGAGLRKVKLPNSGV
jgi:hypothetical protein